jgi:hypothetical protein
MKIKYNEYRGYGNNIQKIELYENTEIDRDFGYDLHSLVTSICINHGFEPELNHSQLLVKIITFYEKIKERILCIIIDKTGLYLKDLDSANRYIKKKISKSGKIPFLRVI